MSIDRIAIIGMSARVPDADGLAKFWANLVLGKNSIHRLSEDELRANGVSEAELADARYVRARPLLENPWSFDNEYFGMSRRESELRNPQHRLFLELCETALQDAGYVSESYPGAIGVYGGCATDRYSEDHLLANRELVDQVGETVIQVSNTIDYLATYASFRLALTGPSLSVRTACSTSLVAIHLACQALRAGDCDMALAGGVEIETPYGRGYVHTPGGIESVDGICRPLDENASGTVFGSGGGIVLLKRLEDAISDDDNIRGVILGSAVNNDGSQKPGFTAPSPAGQSAAIAEAIEVSGVSSSSISYVELHGTATKTGDPVEIQGLAEAFRSTESESRVDPCWLGSVKSNVGHLGPASGVVGLIKVALAMENELIPPTINVERINPTLQLENRGFSPALQSVEWLRSDQKPRRAGVSSFGFGGTNAHLVLEEAPSAATDLDAINVDDPELLIWSAHTAEAMQSLQSQLISAISQSETQQRGIAFTSRIGRRELPLRAASMLRGNSPSDRKGSVETEQSLLLPTGIPFKSLFLFPGQGSQYPKAGRSLERAFPKFASSIRSYLDRMGQILDKDLVAIWERESDARELQDTTVAQPLIFAHEIALAEQLGRAGIRPAMVLGHSVGEIAAATVAGVWTVDDALTVVATRARLCAAQPRGSMRAVLSSEEFVRSMLPDGIWLSAVNAPSQVVVGGKAADIQSFAKRLEEAGVKSVPIRTSHAFHTPVMQGARAEFASFLESFELKPPSLPLFSAAVGRLVTDEEAQTPSFWANQLIEPVLFDAGLVAAFGQDPSLIVEVGPGASLSSLAKRHRSRNPSVVIRPTSAGSPDSEWSATLEVIGNAWVQGASIDWSCLPDRKGSRRVSIPTYPFQRQLRYINRPRSMDSLAVEAEKQNTAAPSERLVTSAITDLSGARLALPTWVPDKVLSPRPASQGSQRPVAVAIMPEGKDATSYVTTALQLAGFRVFPVVLGDRCEASTSFGMVRSSDASDVETLAALLEEAEVDWDLFVYAAPIDSTGQSPASEQNLDFLLTLFKKAASKWRGRAPHPRVIVLAREAIAVTASEDLSPWRAAMSPLVATAALEHGRGWSRLFDVAGVDTETLGLALSDTSSDSVIALRGRIAWKHTRLNLPSPPPEGSLLQGEGHYLITGGTGAIGLALARGLAEEGLQPRLVLMSRNATSLRHSERGRTEIDAICAAGASLELVDCDVNELASLRATLAEIQKSSGVIHGIFHAAGLSGGALLRNHGFEAAKRVMAPKVVGTMNLLEWAADSIDLRFIMLFSSRASYNGLIGSGDYAAANAFMDASAEIAQVRGTKIVSVNWPTWYGTGMASSSGRTVDRTQSNPVWAELLTGDDWIVAEHTFDGVPLLPGTAYVDYVVRAIRESIPDSIGKTISINNAVIVAPLYVRKPTTLEIVFVPAGAHFTVEIRSRVEQATDDLGELHLTAEISFDEAPQSAEVRLPASAEGWHAIEQSAGAPATAFGLGRRFDSIKSVHGRGDDPTTTMGILTLDDEFEDDVDLHPVHPGLLDRALALRLGETDHLPFAWKSVVVRGDLPPTIVATHHMRPTTTGRLTMDLEVTDALGRSLVEIIGFTKLADKSQTGSTFAGGEKRPLDGHGDQVDSAHVAESRSEVGSAVGLTDGILPIVGVALALRLTNSYVPRRVAVVPSREVRGGTNASEDLLGSISIACPTPSGELSAEARSVDLEQYDDDSKPGSGGEHSQTEQRRRTVEQVRRLWSATLGVDRVSDDDDFFELGGDSLIAVQLAAQAANLGLQISVADLFDSPTVAELAESLVKRQFA